MKLKDDELELILSQLKMNITKAEGVLCGLVLRKPDTLLDYTINKKMLSEDALFYIGMTEKLLKKGIEVIDEVSFVTELESMPQIIDTYEKKGGFKTVRGLMNIIDIRNTEGIIADWEKWNLIKSYYDKGIISLEKHWNKIQLMSAEQIYSFIEYQLNDVSISTGCEGLDFENLIYTDDEINTILSGAEIGLQYNSRSPILSGMSLGIPKGELNSISSYINEGKTSFAFNNFVMPVLQNGHKVLIISTEQRSGVFKAMLLMDIIINELKYYKLTRRKFKAGRWTDEDKEIIDKARVIAKDKYINDIVFLKLYDYNTEIVTKAIKKYAQLGVELVLYDVMKFSDSDEQIWKSLIDDSKKLFQCCSKYNVAGLVTLQLAMATQNRIRQIGMNCVSNSKAVFEVMSECFFLRSAWQDELDPTSSTYLKPYRLKKDSNGKFTSEKEEITLNPDKTYKIVRLGKSRNDGTDKYILYQVDFNYNIWKEIGMCHVSDKNKY